jgi:hypothetical protein
MPHVISIDTDFILDTLTAMCDSLSMVQ